MLEQIKQIVDYVQLKVNYSVKETEETESVYLHALRNTVRISTHLGFDSSVDIHVLLDLFNSKYCVIIERGEVLIFNSFRKVGDFLINYFFLSSYETKLKNDLGNSNAMLSQVTTSLNNLENQVQENSSSKDIINKYKKRVKNLEESLQKTDSYKRIIKENEQKQSEYKQEINKLRRYIKDLENECQEAVDLIKILSTDPNAREMVSNKEGKKYFIDNFPKDVQDVLKDIIKEYYGK